MPCGRVSPKSTRKWKGFKREWRSSDSDSAAGQQERERLQTKMAEVKFSLGGLAAVRNAMAREIASIVYPILSIPPEIAAQIFMDYIAAGADSDREGPWLVKFPRAEGGPLLLARVCAAWREIILTLHALWSRLKVTRVQANTPKLLQFWLARAGGRPLDIDTRGVDFNTGSLFATLAMSEKSWIARNGV
ncbi:hypothetical protein B0H17DRAFT_1133873 [Mycena rosella]|uniref:F-box domain-containing protein n=1 Tax=Mycena rosella TaxID=1033263 RepID=A0AAD7DJZ8_MYCRO|nr:hypothetical protein B0H17DRAFT_1133873 [Mycena rosella]